MQNEKIWSFFMYLSNHMWDDEHTPPRGWYEKPRYEECNNVNIETWDETMRFLAERQYNMVLIDVGDGIKYESRPEISAPDAWDKDFLKKKLDEMRALGLEPIPKLNFSCKHHTWLKKYRYMVSTPEYYAACADVIREVCEAFTPKHFHLGMDEETWGIQKDYYYAVIRQHDVWWRDFYHLVACCEKANARPWIWSDYCWAHPEEFYKKMPKSVVQCNWYYSMALDPAAITDEKRKLRLEAFEELDRQGFDQVPTGSNWSNPANMQALTEYCTNHISDEHLMGFMQTPWCLFTEDKKDHLDQSVEKLGESIAWYNNR